MQSARGGSKDPRPSAAGTTVARVLLRFHPTILAAVAVFLINMLILHERLGTNYERRFPRVSSIAPEPLAASLMSASTSSRVFQGLRPRVIRNTCDQGSIGLCKVDPSLRSHTSETCDVYLEDNVMSTKLLPRVICEKWKSISAHERHSGPRGITIDFVKLLPLRDYY